jgi:3-phenylpropionate/cinnamic acid dioxygenase small subunit
MVDHDVREDVAQVLVRYATGINRRDWALFRMCFTQDSEADCGQTGVWHGEEITAWMRSSHKPLGHTMHRITNQVVTSNGDGVAARSYVDAMVLSADNKSGTRAVGYYDDDLTRTAHGWKIARRRFTMVMLQLVPDGTVIDLHSVIE